MSSFLNALSMVLVGLLAVVASAAAQNSCAPITITVSQAPSSTATTTTVFVTETSIRTAYITVSSTTSASDALVADYLLAATAQSTTDSATTVYVTLTQTQYLIVTSQATVTETVSYVQGSTSSAALANPTTTVLKTLTTSTGTSSAKSRTYSYYGRNTTTVAVNGSGVSSKFSGSVTSSGFTASSGLSSASVSVVALSSLNASSTPVSAVATSTSASATSTSVNSTSTPAASATPTVCGESGNFTLNWDDEPNFTPTNATDAPFPPIFNPYHHFYFADGYDYATANEPFPPTSGTKLALYMPNATTEDNGSPYQGLEHSGEIGTGPRAASTAFWFNAYSAELGCDNSGPTSCQMKITGWVYDAATQAETLATQQNVTIPPCPGFENCSLTLVDFTDGFRGLSGIQFLALVNSTERIFFMDDLNMGWYNNTCAAGLQRLQSV